MVIRAQAGMVHRSNAKSQVSVGAVGNGQVVDHGVIIQPGSASGNDASRAAVNALVVGRRRHDIDPDDFGLVASSLESAEPASVSIRNS